MVKGFSVGVVLWGVSVERWLWLFHRQGWYTMFQCEHIYMLTKCIQNMSTLYFYPHHPHIVVLHFSYKLHCTKDMRGSRGGGGVGVLDSLENHKWLWVSLENLAWTPFEKQFDPSGSSCFSKEVRKAL